jgi:hypothetical protein
VEVAPLQDITEALASLEVAVQAALQQVVMVEVELLAAVVVLQVQAEPALVAMAETVLALTELSTQVELAEQTRVVALEAAVVPV